MNSFLKEKWSSVGLNFNPWEYSRAEKQGILLAIFQALNVLAALELSPSDMLDFCLDMESLYNDVPYHSFNHAIDVVVKLYYMLYDLQAASYLASYDIAALLISALCHDCGHPGLNNLFQKNAQTELAQKYPDAILERYSIDLAMECIAKHQLLRNVENLRDPMYSDSTTTEIDVASRMLYSIRCAILNTDMTRHFDVVEECKALVSSLAKKARKFALPKKSELPGASEDQLSDLPHGAAGNSHKRENNLQLPAVHVRARSPSEPVMHRKVLLEYKLTSAPGDAAESRPNGISSTPTSVNPIASSESESSSNDTKPSAVQSRNKRIHIRRSISMSDALLDSTQRQSLVNILMHAVDVFNPVLPWPMCKKWSDLMNMESFNQGDLEKQLSLPLSPNMDRETTDQRQVSLDFGNIIIRPFFTEMVSLFPVDDVLLPALEANMQTWSRLSTDATHEISPPTGANSHMYSWPVEPVTSSASRSTSSSFSEGRRLSIAAGTVDIPPSRLETIRRHSHEGFEAMHRCMVGHLFSKHLEKIQQRRKASYVLNPPQHLQVPCGKQRPAPLGAITTQQHGVWQDSSGHMLSPVTEASYIDDSSAPSTGRSAHNGSNLLDVPSEADESQHVLQQEPSPSLLLTTNLPQTLLTGAGPASASWEVARADYAHTGVPPAVFNQHKPPGLSEHLHSYCITSPPLSSLRQYRSASLDPTLLANMPTAFASAASESSSAALSPKLGSDN
ncbi:hypothetical protein LPJ78_003504 [Coemansia sp. RSA 989]|nr:hypothetical protein LPJ79_002298 [Coemansia sp. RSA 1821]KAJ1864275.1 hypothetical protein LPJ78_003504 [Coemansia sp. RSA 989]KAJ1871834.1 hypothetical protein LPJ55_003594 [Coemansia sp. RSA 990]KAJ2630849.1 hypothetical protein H4R22_002379 [Coemansia sp. RSA 1290]KAJ2676303.1 hypothetical protein IWW42_000591 [Coemansia sp. RSA 1085]